MNCPACGGEKRERVLRVRGTVVGALFALTAVLALLLTAPFLQELAEGVQRSRLPFWKVIVPLVSLLTAVIATVERRARAVCESCGSGTARGLLTPIDAAAVQRSEQQGPTRRGAMRALGAGGATVAAAAVAGAGAILPNRGWVRVGRTFFAASETEADRVQPEWRESRIRSYRRLGRTNALVSDISLGSGNIADLRVAELALERGVNYFDTAPDYAETGSEQLLGRALKGRRDKVFVATKFCVADGHLPVDTPVAEIIAAVEGSLRRLQTDYVDLVHIHACDSLRRLLAPNFHEAFDRLKEQGKARFLGVSTHTPNLETVAHAAIDSGRFDVMMLAYHFGMWPSFGHILEKAHARDVGIVAMKTLKGAKHEKLDGFRDAAGAYSQAAFRWVLSNPHVSCLVISFSKPQHVDEYLYASGAPLRSADTALLERYDRLIAGDYCQPHCGLCLDSCPSELPIHDILRQRMYFRDYGWEKIAMRQYGRLPRNAADCTSCPAPCAGRCPIGVPIREKMLDAHRLLRFAV